MSGVHQFDAYLDGLQLARRGVLLISALDRPTCTGWLLTDSLVVVPKFALTVEDSGYVCADVGGSVAAQVEHRPSSANNFRPALLRLEHALEGRAMSLHAERGRAGNVLVVLHHPGAIDDVQISIGKVVRVDDPTGDDRVIHDISTSPGSAGAPLLGADTLSVMGMHMGKTKASAEDPGADLKSGIGILTLLDELRTAACWPEIADHHRLARGRPPTQPAIKKLATDPELISAALQWSVDPAGLDQDVRERLRVSVVDPDESTWSVTSGERRRLIYAAGSIQALQRVHTRVVDPSSGQRAIDRIITGPPFDLDTEPMDELPYWLQASEWFADIVPDLPQPAEVQRAIARRRVRERLKGVAGEGLVGREDPLNELTRWYENPDAGPLMLTGVGGVGKSALLARFALDLPPSTLLLWLDFDRPDLAAEVAESVLQSLSEQAAAQLDDFTKPAVDPSNWGTGADALASALAARADAGRPALLVLDGFEIAQASKRYAVVWDVLERIMQGFREVRVIISGRAPVVDLTLGGKSAQPLHLSGLTDEATAQYLGDRSIFDPAVVATVMRAADGIPLRLQLAARLINEGDPLADLESSLPHAMVEGYLYGRVLNRVVERRLRVLARDALVLRRLPAEMIGVVLRDGIPADMNSSTVFDQLSREMALVDNIEPGSAGDAAAPLRMRSEVRGPLLQLLATDDADRVREIDRRAVDWYREHDDGEAATRAELTYHLLRLNDIAGAEATWHDDCAPLLLNAEADIPGEFGAAREWLLERTTGARDHAAELRFWEEGAYERIRSLLARGHPHSVRAVLDEFPDRSAGGPLIAYDAWVRWALDHDLAGAAEILDDVGLGSDTYGVQRTVLRAFLAAKMGDPDRADAALTEVDSPALATDADGPSGQLAAQAARVRSRVNLASELSLVDELERHGDALGTVVCGFLTAGDAVLPALGNLLGSVYALESYVAPAPVAESVEELNAVAALRIRAQFADIPSSGYRDFDRNLLKFVQSYPVDQELRLRELLQTAEALKTGLPEELQPGFGLALDLFKLARQRWRIADSTLLMTGLAQTMATQPFTYQMQIALTSTLAVFRGQTLHVPAGELDHLMASALSGVAPSVWLRAPAPDDDLTRRILALERLPDSPPPRLPDNGWFSGTNAIYFYLCGPDPLSVLCQRALGFNELGD